MNAALSIKDEVRGLIEDLPERKLYALRDFLTDDEDDDDELTEEEMAAFDRCERNWKENPESFHDWDDVKKEMGF